MGQLGALFYKNWLLYKRGIVGNILEILVSIFFIFFVILTRNLDKPIDYVEQSFLANSTYARTINGTTNVTAFLKYFLHNLKNLHQSNCRADSNRRCPCHQIEHNAEGV